MPETQYAKATMLCAAGLAAVVMLAAAPVTARQKSARETFTAFAVSTGGARSGPVANQVVFTVERWSSNAQRQRLADALREKGATGLLDAMQDLPEVGRMRTPNDIGYALRYADQQPLPEGGRRVVLATDRPIQFWETWNAARTLDYPFTLVELQLDKEGRGTGKLSLAVKVIAKNGRVVLENWDSAPVNLNEVRTER